MKNKKIDWLVTLVPIITILTLAILFFVNPLGSNEVLSKIRFFFGDTLGTYYLIIGLGFFLVSIYMAFSKYGNIVLGGKNERPKYSFIEWGSMMFTCGLAADILFYSFSEWVMYGTSEHVMSLGSIQEWSGVFPLFHWSLIPWSFYLVLAVSFGYMLHVKNINRQRFSQACNPVIGDRSYNIVGRIIDIFSVFALLAGTATTFSVATPLMSELIIKIFNINYSRTLITIIILLITCAVYTYAVMHGFKGISILSKVCMILFYSLMVFVLVFGGNTKYIIDTGFESLGRMIQNFIGLSTYTDPLRETNFAQDWTIYYWAYWIVWCVAAPFFIGNISKGRTVKQVVLGGYAFGVTSTILSFIIFGNYSMGLQMQGKFDFVSLYSETGDLYGLIVSVLDTLPASSFVSVVVLLTMIAFYATSFDSIAYTAACYSYYRLKEDEHPHKSIQLMWCIILIILPIVLVFSDSSMSNIQAVSIISAFPLGIIMIIIVWSFFKDSKNSF